MLLLVHAQHADVIIVLTQLIAEVIVIVIVILLSR